MVLLRRVRQRVVLALERLLGWVQEGVNIVVLCRVCKLGWPVWLWRKSWVLKEVNFWLLSVLATALDPLRLHLLLLLRYVALILAW